MAVDKAAGNGTRQQTGHQSMATLTTIQYRVHVLGIRSRIKVRLLPLDLQTERESELLA